MGDDCNAGEKGLSASGAWKPSVAKVVVSREGRDLAGTSGRDIDGAGLADGRASFPRDRTRFLEESKS